MDVQEKCLNEISLMETSILDEKLVVVLIENLKSAKTYELVRVSISILSDLSCLR